MLKEWQRRRAARRVEPGNGKPLKPFRWWQPLSRVLFHLPLRGGDGGRTDYAVEVRYAQRFFSEDGKGRAHLYLDGRHHAESGLPAAFPVRGGTIEVALTPFGLKRCHYVTDGGAEHQLVPDRRSGEGRRARLDREHPVLSRAIGLCSLVLLVVPALLLVPQLIEAAFQVPPVTERFGTFTSPVQLPLWLNIALTLGASAASTERALRLRYNWLLDSAAQGE
ncbi:hypothetical protein OUQ99_16755 [Streptomonospora nanhaiensis]|uniref:Uncharacterized protein n=1 Tax=Streptomonospora nanhaiensis TaxID=1323731 RepID=A0ABY6YF72_9ACTN|nr:hypothetical protein [Streptomonospora nanhaiensis]WAE70890.1 hypothetical protein OUQ99_16755 [Streptomonospora nanhaiensis]